MHLFLAESTEGMVNDTMASILIVGQSTTLLQLSEASF